MSERRFGLLALLLYLALSATVLLPGLPSLDEYAIGDTQSDSLKHVWGQWWVHRHLTQNHTFPLDMDLANFPDGGRFYCLDGANAFVTVLLRPAMNAVAAYNLLYLLHLALAGFAAFLLAREMTGNRQASLVAGAIYAFSPYVLAFPVGSGVAETAFLFPLPLVVLFGLRTIRERSWLNPIAAALLLLLQGFATWSYGIYAGLMLFFIAMAFLLSRLAGRYGRTGGYFADTKFDACLLGRAAVFCGILLAAALPLYLTIAGTVQGDDVMYQRHLSVFPGPGPRPIEEPQLTSFSWVDFILPGQAGLRADMFVDKLMYVAYAGYLALALAIIGLWRKRRGALLFGAMAAFFFAFALGPVMFATHARQWPAYTNPIYLIFYYAFPLFNATIHSVDRFAVAFQLALGVVAAFGLSDLLARISNNKQRSALVTAAFLLIPLEYVTFSPAPWPVAATPAVPEQASQELAGYAENGAVLDLPPYHGGTRLFVGDIFFQQTIHMRPIPYSLEGVSPSVRANAFYNRAEAISLGNPRPGDPPLVMPPADAPPCAGLAELSQMGFRFVVYRPDRLLSEQTGPMADLLEGCLGEGRRIGKAVLFPIPVEQ